MPEVTPYTAESGNKYIREKPLEEIIEKLLTPQEEEESDDEEEKDEGKDADSIRGSKDQL